MHKVFAAVLTVALIALAGQVFALDRDNNGVQGDEGIYTSTPYTGPLILSETAIFPVSSDSWTVASSPYWWHVGDTVVGSRPLGLASVNHADVHLVIDYSVLSPPGFVNLELRLNGTTVGDFDILAYQYVVDTSFDFPAIAVAGSIELRYWETNQVASGYGSVILNSSGSSSVTLDGGPTATEPSTWGQIKALYQ